MSVEIFAVDISARLNDSVDNQLKFFSIERQKKILKYRFNADRNRTVWAELLVRNIVAEKFFCSFEKVQVTRDSVGKPYIKNFPVEISLSHAGNWIVCSVGEVKSGVDVEMDSSGALEIAERFFLPSEYEKIISLNENLRGLQFLKYWTIKESYFKLTGDKNFLKVDVEKILCGESKVVSKNFLLNTGVIVGVCTYKH